MQGVHVQLAQECSLASLPDSSCLLLSPAHSDLSCYLSLAVVVVNYFSTEAWTQLFERRTGQSVSLGDHFFRPFLCVSGVFLS